LPSPIFPVLAFSRIASTARWRAIVGDHDFEFNLWKKSTVYSCRDKSRCAPSAGRNPFTSLRVIPSTPAAIKASRTGSALNGLMMASIFFTAAN
jgi:hypothetical protein